MSNSVISSPLPAINGLKFQLALSQHLIDLCRPLSHINFDYFHFIRSYQDGSRISLTNNPCWMEHYYQNEFYKSPKVSKNLNNSRTGSYLWTPASTSTVLASLKSGFSIDSGMIIVDRYDHYGDFYYFGSKQSILYNDVFPEHLVALTRRFILYFNDQCSDLIKKAESQRIFVQEDVSHTNTEHPFNHYEQFLAETSFDRHILNDGKNQVVFSKREYHCIQYLLKGYSAKSIAEKLDISSRTVEYHLDKLRHRMGCYNKSHLIDKLAKFQWQCFDSL
jgi:DNA-binding CsgD family transcriptional regulator